MTDDSLGGDLLEHIYKTHANVPPLERRRSHWVMNYDWLNETRKLETAAGSSWWTHLGLAQPEMLLGLPIEVRDDGGVPHLELNT